MDEWNPSQYLKFEDERTRAARDLLAQVPLTRPRHVVDLGCGPGNSTELLVERYPAAVVSGVDSSHDMLQAARKRLPHCDFVEADLADWAPAEPADLLFANAVYQWVPNHLAAMRRVLQTLPAGGVLAAQMPANTGEPSHLAMEKAAARFGIAETGRDELPAVAAYYDALKPLCTRVEIWQTIYHFPLANPRAIAEWFRGSALRPFLAALNAPEADQFVSAYVDEIAPAYPPRADGQVLLPFPRLFIVATR